MKNPGFLRSVTNYIFGFFAFLLLLNCGKKENYLLEVVPSSKTGVTFINTLNESDSLNILDYLYFYNGGGVAMGDINNDGLPELFFSSNMQSNKLYLNKGNLKFEDISEAAGITGSSNWNTGSVMADVNGDGWLDIYVLAVVGINGFEGKNELYINNKDNTFSEQAATYGLDFKAYGTTASFFDYDLDGDLDLFILNHAVHTQESFGKASLRNTRNEKTGDLLLRNDNGKFTDVSEEAGIFGGINGYGLGLATADFNMDGYPDIYIGNDFHEDDYFYLNNGDGTFTDSLRAYFGHTSRFSMGSDAADINHDGLPDLISLDMLPEDEVVLKSSEGDDTYQTLQMRTETFGYHNQYTRNMLYLNQPKGAFTETALQSGVAATDWSWSALFGDYDMDGNQDLFVSNGIPRRPNDIDFIRYVSSAEIQKKINESRLVDQEALDKMPTGHVSNYIFQGDGKGSFTDRKGSWISADPTISGATAIGDLDNDGDLDVVTNNLNSEARIYKNTSDDKQHYLKLKVKYKDGNPFGIGTKVYAWIDGNLQYRELYASRGWQASSDPVFHFGLGEKTVFDSIRVVWPDRTSELLENTKANQTLTITPSNSKPYTFEVNDTNELFRKVTDNLGIDFSHKEDFHYDFDYQKLIPYQVSKQGPALAIGDIDGDDLQDIFIGGARNQPAAVFLQKQGSFSPAAYPSIQADSTHEDVSAVIMPNKELIVTSGGNVVSPSVTIMADRSYALNSSGAIIKNLQERLQNSSVITQSEDGDLFIGGYCAPLNFGSEVSSHLLRKNGSVQQLDNLGMVTDAIWDDFDGDGQQDLIVIGEWMAPTFFKNDNGELTEVDLISEPLNGLWQAIHPFDIDADGDTDYLLGNWGMNTKFDASGEAPMLMYYADFDDNGTTETVLATQRDGRYYPLLGLNDLLAQMNFLRKKFTDYTSFAGKSMAEVFGEELLQKATVYEVHTLASGFLRNNNNTFTFTPFSFELQTAPLKEFTSFDFYGNGKESVLVGGNYFGVIPFHGRFDSFPGAIIENEDVIETTPKLGLDLSLRSIKHLKVISINNTPYLLVIPNNEDAEVYQITQKNTP